MLNLLFISNNARAELLRGHFQQLLKMRVELVADFDHGLKDVFEKRPVVVCIQEQIAGVTGESVARHIQLLLGSGAPAFILLHEAGSKARLLPGLFEHLIDLSASFEVVTSSLGKALQTLLKEHWEMLYAAPVAAVLEANAGRENQAAAEQLVDDFMSESSIFHPERVQPFPGTESGGPAAFESLLEHEVPGGPPAELHAAASSKQEAPAVAETAELAEKLEQPASVPRQTVTNFSERQASKPLPMPRAAVRDRTAPSTEMAKDAGPADAVDIPVADLLQTYETQYRRKKLAIRLAILCVLLLIVAAVSICFVWSPRKTVSVRPSVKSQQVLTPALPDSRPNPADSAQKKFSSSRSVQQPSSGLPAFIPLTAPDANFTVKHPGWKRYRAETRDYRLFFQREQLLAVQVLAIGSSDIPLAEVRRNLKILTGLEQFSIDKRERKQGLLLEHARVGEHAELLVYRSGTNGPIRAYVYARQ